jgi:hypothetical protein
MTIPNTAAITTQIWWEDREDPVSPLVERFRKGIHAPGNPLVTKGHKAKFSSRE